MKIQSIQILFISCLLICSLKFFGARFLSDALVNYSQFILVFISIILSIPYLFNRWTGFVLPVQILTLSILISMVMAWLTWGQSIQHTILATVPLLIWPTFFYLNHIKLKNGILERIIIVFGIAYAGIYFYQYSNPGLMLFGKPNWGDEFQEDRGVIRIIPPGSSIFFLTIFVAINKFTTSNRYKLFWGALVVLGLIIPVLQVTRISLLAVVTIYLMHFFRGDLVRKSITLICSILAFIFVVSYEIKPIRGMIAEQKENVNAGEKYIRVLSADYYLTDFSPQLINYGFGNGVPYWGVSKYGKTIADMNEYYGFYLEDLGIISIYVLFGPLAVFAYLLIWIESILIKVPEEFRYVKYFLWFLLANALTTGVLYNSDYLIVTVLVLHIFQSVYVFDKKHERIKSDIRSLKSSQSLYFPDPVKRSINS